MCLLLTDFIARLSPRARNKSRVESYDKCEPSSLSYRNYHGESLPGLPAAQELPKRPLINLCVQVGRLRTSIQQVAWTQLCLPASWQQCALHGVHAVVGWPFPDRIADARESGGIVGVARAHRCTQRRREPVDGLSACTRRSEEHTSEL